MGAYSCETAHLFCWNIHLQHHNWTVVQPPFYWCLTFSTCTPYVGSVPTGLCRGHIPRRHSSTFSLHPLLLCRCRTPRTGGSHCYDVYPCCPPMGGAAGLGLPCGQCTFGGG